jgi:hypothetical protein
MFISESVELHCIFDISPNSFVKFKLNESKIVEESVDFSRVGVSSVELELSLAEFDSLCLF